MVDADRLVAQELVLEGGSSALASAALANMPIKQRESMPERDLSAPRQRKVLSLKGSAKIAVLRRGNRPKNHAIRA